MRGGGPCLRSVIVPRQSARLGDALIGLGILDDHLRLAVHREHHGVPRLLESLHEGGRVALEIGERVDSLPSGNISILRAGFDPVLLDHFSADQVLLDDLLQHLRGAGVVPDAIGVDDGDGTFEADLQAVGL